MVSFDSTRDVVANASRESLRKALSSDVRVLHLLCHGGPGGLLLEGEDITSPTALATTLEPFARTLRMIVLCVCRSGDQEPKNRHMGSTARELHRLGIPWVVASRSPLHFQDSVLLTEKIYAGIRNSLDDVEAAIVSARRALHEPCRGTARTGCRKYAWLSLQLYAAPTDTRAKPPTLPDALHPRKNLDHSPSTETPIRALVISKTPEELLGELDIHTQSVTGWRSTLPNGHAIPRPELEEVKQLLSDQDVRVIALLGEGGSGKSALLANLGVELESREDIFLVCLRLDSLDKSVRTLPQFQDFLGLSIPFSDAIASLSRERPVVVLIDQLDSLCNFMVQRSARLQIIMSTIGRLSRLEHVQVVVACRNYEYEHDVRFGRLEPRSINLKLPEWSEIEQILTSSGIEDLNILPSELREELRSPQVLATFLQLIQESSQADELNTYHAMRRELWEIHVLRHEDATQRKEALYELAEWLTLHERQDRPLPQMDEYRQQLGSLASGGWLTQDTQRGKISFRHQSLYEFVFSRFVVENNRSIQELVLQTQGLAVRPRLWSVLGYLREQSEKHYQQEFLALWKSNELRKHLRYLLLDFLGSVKYALPFEIGIIKHSLCQSSPNRTHAWAAVGRSAGWFQHLYKKELPEEMLKHDDPTRVHGFGLLFRAVAGYPGPVLDLVESHWLQHRKDRFVLAARLFRNLKTLGKRECDVAEKICYRLGLNHVELTALIPVLFDLQPNAAFSGIRESLRGAIDEWESRGPEDYREEVAARLAECGVPSWDTTESRIARARREDLRQLFEGSSIGTHGLGPLVEQEPAAFLEALMPEFLRGLKFLARSEFVDPMRYPGELRWPESIHMTGLVNVVAKAVTSLAKRSPSDFEDFVQRHARYDLVTVHHLILQGLTTVADKAPHAILDYLQQDRRNLWVGKNYMAPTGTYKLFREVGSTLPREIQQNLADTLFDWKRVPHPFESDAKMRREGRREFRQHRLHLLRLLNTATLDNSTRRKIQEEERALPNLRPSIDHKSGWIVRPARAPTKISVRSMLAEQGDQAATDLLNLAKANPEECFEVISDLQPGKHDRSVSKALEQLASSGYCEEKILQFFWDAEEKGFGCEQYRKSVAEALKLVAERKEVDGLTDCVCERLKDWLDNAALGRNSTIVTKKQTPRDDGILYSQSYPNPPRDLSYSILTCLYAGLILRKEPAWDAWQLVLARHLERDETVNVWAHLFRHILAYRNAEKSDAEQFLGRLFAKYPQLMDTPQGLYLIDWLQVSLDREATRAWIETVRQRGSLWHAQAFGELLALRNWRFQDDAWATEQLHEIVNASRPFSETTAYARDGVTVMTAKLVKEEGIDGSPLVNRLLDIAMTSRENSSTRSLNSAIWTLRESKPCEQGAQILRCLVNNPHHYQHKTFIILDVLGSYVDEYPGVVADVCEMILEQTKGCVPSPEKLLDLLVTLQDTQGYEVRGLDLFDNASELRVHGLEKFLESPAFTI